LLEIEEQIDPETFIKTN
jgi:hypothetical protein